MQKERLRQNLLCIFWMVLASQVNINLFGSDFRISIACTLLPLYVLVLGEYPVWAVSAASAAGSFALRVTWVWLNTGVFSGAGYWQEMLFYVVYGLLTELWMRRLRFRVTVWTDLLPLCAIDFVSNLAELFCRGGGLLTVRALAGLGAVAVLRTVLVCVFRAALERQKFYLLKREHAERYERLMLLISRLHGEVVWMRKSASAVENTMNTAYGLYTRLQREESPAAQDALDIAKDVHEIKKEYQLITRGIQQALRTETEEDAMDFRELWRVLRGDLELTAAHAGVAVDWDVCLEADFRTRRQYALLSILRNLLDNAVEAAEGGTAHIRFSLRRDGDMDVFTVASRGKPISPEDQAHLFEPGFSTKINYATGQIGRGVGLCLVRDLTEEELGGTVKLEVRGPEAAFRVTVPAEKVEEPV